MNATIEGKTLIDFDQLSGHTNKCELLLQYMNRSKRWLENIGKRGETGRWKMNLLNYRPQHADLREGSGMPRIRFFLAYSNIKTMMPEMIDKWPVMQCTPDQMDDKEFVDVLQARLDKFLSDANFNELSQGTVQRGMIQESALLRMVLKINGTTGVVGAEFVEEDIFGWFPAPGFRGTGMNLAEGEALFQSFAKPVSKELAELRWGINAIVENDAKEYTTAGQLGLCDDQMGQAILREFYWYKDGAIRGIWFLKTAETKGGVYQYKIVNDFEVDKDGKYGKAILPVFRYVNDPDEMTGFGTGEPELVANNQKEINFTLSSAAAVLKRCAIPPIFLSEDAYNNGQESIVKRFMSGLPIIRKRPEDIQFGDAPTFNQGTMPFVDAVHNLSKASVGLYDAIAGDIKYSGQPMGAILALQEASRARVRLKLQSDVANWMRSIGRCVLKTFKEKDPYILQAMQLQVGGDAVPYDGQNMQGTGNFDITMLVAGGLPKGRYATEARALEMMNAKIFTPLRAIDDLAEPDTEKIKQEYIEWNELQTEMERQANYPRVEKEFEKACLEMLNIANNRAYVEGDKAEIARYKIVEDSVVKMMKAFKELLDSGVWTQLPPELQDRFLNVYKTVPSEQLPAPQISQPQPKQEQAQ